MREEMRHVRYCVASTLHHAPIFHLFAGRLSGKRGTASKPNMMQYMRAKEDLALIPGGFEEATITW
jgi:hypothetical protein